MRRFDDAEVTCFSSWSGGKDSCLALYRVVCEGLQPRRLITMMCEDGLRSRSHGLPAAVLRAQAAAIGVPVELRAASWATYEETFREAARAARRDGIAAGCFGDIDLPGHRAWVERVCAAEGIRPLLPLWLSPRESLLAELVQARFRAEIVAVKGDRLGRSFLGRVIDHETIAALRQAGVDLAGENGEYHTVVTGGPLFRRPLRLVHGRQVLRDGYWFSDVSLS